MQSAVGQTALSLKNTKFNFISRGGKWLFGTEQTIRFILKALQNDQEILKETESKHFLKFLQCFS